ncbi:hypothetical protein RIF29_17638 [Crotalaria pallida]|uniref:Uncharacterized protein n=1 Tax=Crotalaria pallida TaxID=3830 RepID=A0AAN9FR91_CROPI
MHHRRRSSLKQRTESSSEPAGPGASSSETEPETESRSTAAASLGQRRRHPWLANPSSSSGSMTEIGREKRETQSRSKPRFE